MGRVGPDNWNCVSIDSAGVPRGGRYGRPAWFAQKLKRYGLSLCWSRSWNSFALVRKKGGRWTFLRHLANGGMANHPWRLGPNALALILYTWNRFGEQTPAMIAHMEQEAQKRLARRAADEQEALLHDDYRRRDVMEYVDISAGRRKVMSLPRIVVPKIGLRRVARG